MDITIMCTTYQFFFLWDANNLSFFFVVKENNYPIKNEDGKQLNFQKFLRKQLVSPFFKDRLRAFSEKWILKM